MFSCEYCVTFTSNYLKENLRTAARLLLKGRHWFSANEILKFIIEIFFSWFVYSGSFVRLQIILPRNIVYIILPRNICIYRHRSRYYIYYLYIYIYIHIYIYIYIRNKNKYYKYCCFIRAFFNVIKVLLVYNPNYSFCFPPGWY